MDPVSGAGTDAVGRVLTPRSGQDRGVAVAGALVPSTMIVERSHEEAR